MLWVLLDKKIIFGTDFSYGTKTISVLLQLQFSTQLLHDHDTAPLQSGSHIIISHGQIVSCERGKVWSKSQPHNLCRSSGDLTAVCGQVAAWFI